jgi:hypothetical protein
MPDWKSKIILESGETTQFVGRTSKGFMGETDVDTFNVIAADGTKMGDVTVEDHTAVKGFRRTITVTQRDAAGKTIVQESWNP